MGRSLNYDLIIKKQKGSSTTLTFGPALPIGEVSSVSLKVLTHLQEVPSTVSKIRVIVISILVTYCRIVSFNSDWQPLESGNSVIMATDVSSFLYFALSSADVGVMVLRPELLMCWSLRCVTVCSHCV
jgi:hypothetical protein